MGKEISLDPSVAYVTPMARQKLSMSEINIAGRAEALERGPGPWKEAPDPKNGVGGMAKPLNMRGFETIS